jgi:hypothetical protein
MRNLSIILGAVVAICAAPAAAKAQSLDQVIGVIGGATSLGYNPCSYVSGSTAKKLCQINRAARLANDSRRVVGNRSIREWNKRSDRFNQLLALQKACKAGDQISCQRTGGATPESMEIARALMSACRAGDRHSCQRMDNVMGH